MKAVDLLQQQSETSANPERNAAHQFSNPRAVINYISTHEEDFDLDETDGAVITGKPHLTKNLRDSYSKLNGNVIKTEIKPDSNGDSTLITNGGYNEKYNDGRSVENGVSRGKSSGDANPFREIKLPNGDVPKLSEHNTAAFEVAILDKTSCKRPETLSFSLPERSEVSPKNHVVNGTKKSETPLVNGINRSDENPPLVNGSRRSEDIQPLINGIKKTEEVLPLMNGVKRLEEVQGLVNTPKKSDVNSVHNSEEVLNGAKTCEDNQPLVNGVKKLEELHPLTNGCGVSNGVSAKQDEPALVADRQGRLINGGSAEEAESPTATWDRAVAEVKEQAFARLQEELRRAHQELRLRDEEVTRLSRIREEVEAELEELTASLFQEAHNMVREANVRQAAAERSFKESQMQVEVLTAEVAALKTLVLTSTPSRPNPHLHPQIDPRGARTKDDATIGGVSLFNRKHRRSPSHFNLKYGRENSPPESPVKEQRPTMPDPFETKDGWEVDPNIHKEFVAWKQSPKVDKADPFVARVYSEDINLCLDFTNQQLGAKVQEAIEEGNIFIEAVSDKSKSVFPKKCALLEAPRQCHYRMKLGDQEQWHCISQICRNRIIAVCDFLNYLRYIERGLVKSSVHDVYWEITRLRKEMVLARLGLALTT